MRKVAAEILNGKTEDTFSNKDMENGITTEAEAREYYSLLHDCPVREVGFVERDEYVGCSPDGLVGEDGGIEIKVVLPSTHINNIDKDKMQTTYIPQVQGQLFVLDRKWIDWISYSPTMAIRPYYAIRIYRDEPYIASGPTCLKASSTDSSSVNPKVTPSRRARVALSVCVKETGPSQLT